MNVRFLPHTFACFIVNINASTSAKKSVRYNMAGQQVNASYKGLVIENGKKFVQK